MLLKLVVKNFAIIDELSIDFDNNLSVITGETGAGKSILLGALELILGKRANHSVILNKDEKCVVEAVFEVASSSKINTILSLKEFEVFSDLILRREINPNGRSRAFINDTPAKIEDLESIGGLLVDMHRQFDNYELLQPIEQLYIIDDFLQLNEERNNYTASFKEFAKLSREYELKKQEVINAKAEQDYLQFVFNEIEELQLKSNEIESWSNQLNLLENAQSIKENLLISADQLRNNEQSIIGALQNIAKETGAHANISTELEEIYNRLNSTIEELKDISAEIEIQEEQISTDPEQLNIISEKVELANKLLLKHNAQNTEELISIRDSFADKLENINRSDSDISSLHSQIDLLKNKCTSESEKLSKKRISGIKKFIKQVNKTLPELGFVKAKFDIQHSFKDMNLQGIDDLKFLFDANNTGKLQELRKAISGGEMSRIMLIIKSLLAHTTDMPCMIFDEIDTGISGETALKVGKVLQDLSAKHQVISITHLPQIAAQAKQHLFVYKDMQKETNFTSIKKLSETERVEAIAQMLSGKQGSETAKLAAKELMGIIKTS